jgi:WD40 repeat protein
MLVVASYWLRDPNVPFQSGWDLEFAFWDLRSKNRRGAMRFQGYNHSTDAWFSPDGKTLIVSPLSELKGLYSLQAKTSGERPLEFSRSVYLEPPFEALQPGPPLGTPERTRKTIEKYGGALSPDGTYLAKDGGIRFGVWILKQPLGPAGQEWVLESPLRVAIHRGSGLRGPGNPIGDPTTSPDGKVVARVDEFTIQLLDAATGRPIGPALDPQGSRGHKRIVTWAFSPDSTYFVAATSDRDGTTNYIGGWEVATGLMVVADVVNSPCRRVSFAPDGRTANVDVAQPYTGGK